MTPVALSTVTVPVLSARSPRIAPALNERLRTLCVVQTHLSGVGVRSPNPSGGGRELRVGSMGAGVRAQWLGSG